MPTRSVKKSAPEKKSIPAKKSAPAKTVQPVVPYFNQKALDFLRQLKRNNRREWFEARREIYERELKAPMLALIEKITEGMTEYAPAHVRPAQKSMLRIYRDTRFSADKTPYKTHLAAWWARSGAEKTSGSGYYCHVSPTELVIAAGVFMPPKEQLLAIRQHLLEQHEEFKRLIEAKKLRTKMTLHDTAALTRPPKGFPADHPAIEWIKGRQWGVIATLPADPALQPRLAETIGGYFRLSQPLVDFLNEPLLKGMEKRKKPLFGLY
jgi:uncharacterized protein (TIGR02453 family)